MHDLITTEQIQNFILKITFKLLTEFLQTSYTMIKNL